jgi:hypothetical protein
MSIVAVLTGNHAIPITVYVANLAIAIVVGGIGTVFFEGFGVDGRVAVITVSGKP